MLKTRLITAAILIPLVLLVLFSGSTALFVGMLGIFVGLGAWEWGGLCLWDSKQRHYYAASILGTGMLAFTLMAFSQTWIIAAPLMLLLNIVGMLFWGLALYWVIQYQCGNDLLPSSDFTNAIIGILLLLPTWFSLFYLYNTRVELVFFLLLLIWTADTGAYFFGKSFGKSKLAAQVSPGKTWEGVAGGIFFSSLFTLSAGLWYGLTGYKLWGFVAFAGFIVLASILGDLFESLYKRKANLKDSSQLLPGHGGILDRVDSLTAAAPLFVGGMTVLGWLW